MSYGNRVILGIGIALAVAGGIVWNINLNTIDRWEHKGQEVFYTQSDYSQFKQSLVDDRVIYWEADALSSEPPIIVTFEIITVKDYPLPYGNIRPLSKMAPGSQHDSTLFALIGVIVGGGLLAIALTNIAFEY